MSSHKTKAKKRAPKKTAPAKPAPKKKPSADAGTKKQKAPAAVDESKIIPSNIRSEETELPLAQIASVYNARTDFDWAWIRGELKDSIQQHGILERLWVYRLPKPTKQGETHGLIAGESRWHAAKLTTHLMAPVKIFDCTEKQAIELGLINNLQRKNLSVLDEARAYRKMIDEHGYKAWDESDPEHSVGHRINGSKTNIYAVLKLVELPKLGQQAVQSGELSPSVAVRIARIPNEKLRGEALQEAIRGHWTDDEAAKKIEDRYMKELKGAPFDRKNPDLNPERGACDTCPFRSGNQKDLFPEAAKGRGDICTDPACFRLKCKKSFKLRAAAHKAKGGKVLDREEAEKAGLHSYSSHIGGFMAGLDNRAYEIGENNKTWRQVLKPVLDDGRLVPDLALANDGSGQHFELAAVGTLKKWANELGLNKRQEEQQKSREQTKALKLKEKADASVLETQIVTIAAAVLEGKRGEYRDWLRATAAGICGKLERNVADGMCARLGVSMAKEKDEWSVSPPKCLQKHALQLVDLRALEALITEALLRNPANWGCLPVLAPFSATTGADLAEIDRNVRLAANTGKGKPAKKKGKADPAQPELDNGQTPGNPKPRLWEQLTKQEKKLAKDILGDQLDEGASFLVDLTFQEAEQVSAPEPQPGKWELEISSVVDDRKHGEKVTLAEIARDFGVTNAEAQLISDAAYAILAAADPAAEALTI